MAFRDRGMLGTRLRPGTLSNSVRKISLLGAHGGEPQRLPQSLWVSPPRRARHGGHGTRATHALWVSPPRHARHGGHGTRATYARGRVHGLHGRCGWCVSGWADSATNPRRQGPGTEGTSCCLSTSRLGGRFLTCTLKPALRVSISRFQTVVKLLMKTTERGHPCRMPLVARSQSPGTLGP